MTFDAEKELRSIRAIKRAQRKKRYHGSKLDKFYDRLLELKSANKTLVQIQVILSQPGYLNKTISTSTLHNWFKKNERTR